MKRFYMTCLSAMFLSSAMAATTANTISFKPFTLGAGQEYPLYVQTELKPSTGYQVNCIFSNTSGSFFNYPEVSMSFASNAIVNPVTNSYILNGHALNVQGGWLNGNLSTFVPDNVLTINNVMLPPNAGQRALLFRNNSNYVVQGQCEAIPSTGE